MPDSSPKSVVLPESDARDVLFAEMLEKTAGADRRWSCRDRDAATRDARKLAGEYVTPASFLPLRARLVAARLHANAADAFGTASFGRAALLLTIILSTVALISGMLTDRLATDGSRINLLSPPLLLLVVWNLAVYLFILIKAIVPKHAAFRLLPVRDLLVKILLKAAGLSAASLEARTTLLLPQCRWIVARALHLAAIMFALGLLAGMAVRGIGTAYLIGWESTWFAGNPEAVHAILAAAYGHLPFCPPIPDVNSVAELAFDARSATPADAAPWLLRLMSLLTVTIILPRLLLVVQSTLRLAACRRRVSLCLETPYYRAILSTASTPSSRTSIIVDSTGSVNELPERWQNFKTRFKALQSDSGIVELLTESAWDDTMNECLAGLKSAVVHHLLLAFDPAATPEVEVHGAMMETASAWCATRHSPAPIVILDLAQINERFGIDSPTAGSRTALWQTFAAERGLKTIAADIRSDNDVARICAELTKSNGNAVE